MKKIFLTGASSGIGLAIAKALVARGDEVWGTSRDLARLPQLDRLHPVRLDLCDRNSIAEAFASALQEAGSLDVIINNAGAGHFGAAEMLPSETLRDQFELLFFGQVELCQLALRAMRAQSQRRGLIVNISSLASRLPVPFTAAYNAGKAALAAWTTTLQLELGDSPIRIVDVQPGDICTDFNEAIRKDETTEPRYAPRMQRAWHVIDHNVKHAPQPEMVAQRILALTDEDDPPPRLTVGDIFQARIAPPVFAMLPPTLRVWGLRRYYGI